jgi:hypothetical protein
MKKTWESPKLIVLVRTRPEENVLAACKAHNGQTAGAQDAYLDCTLETYNCALCSAQANS